MPKTHLKIEHEIKQILPRLYDTTFLTFILSLTKEGGMNTTVVLSTIARLHLYESLMVLLWLEKYSAFSVKIATLIFTTVVLGSSIY